MQATRKAAVRFKERSELLDFLLEVSAAITLTLDLDQLLANVAEIVHKVLPYDLFAILLYSERRRDLRIRYAVGHRDEVVRNLSIALGEGITGAAAAAREPLLVADVRNDPRYLNTVDAVRTELAVPMTARGKLVGVIDLQSTRVNAYTEYDRALMRLIAARVAHRHRQRAPVSPRGAAESHAQDALQHLARVLLHPRPERTAEQDRQHHARPDPLRRLQHPLRRSRSQGAEAPLQHPLRSARQHR